MKIAKTCIAWWLMLLLAACAPMRDPQPPWRVAAVNGGEAGIFANAYVVETRAHVVLIDASLLVGTAQALRSAVLATGKPLAAVALTHGHPDHYNGLAIVTANADVPIYATAGTRRTIEADDAAKDAQWRPVFGEQWPRTRRFPNRTLADGQGFEVDGVRFVVHDLGPGESHSDAYWTAEAGGRRVAFIGDVVLEGVHAYLSDGHTGDWLRNIERLRGELTGVERIYPGHGRSGGVELLDGQREYLEAYRAEVRRLAGGRPRLSDEAKAALEKTITERYPDRGLRFLVKLGADAVAGDTVSSASKQ
jgi:glyoxylase-like metal-dependent hydrolase (beta-lactamase superfamily II)